MEKENIVLIRINGKNTAKKHASSLKEFLQNNLPDREKVEVLVEINKNFNFNVSIDGYEIFAKRKFWNRYPNYKTINNKIKKHQEKEDVYKAIKASYDWHNKLF